MSLILHYDRGMSLYSCRNSIKVWKGTTQIQTDTSTLKCLARGKRKLCATVHPKCLETKKTKQKTKNLYTRIGGHGGGSTLVHVRGLCANQMFKKCSQRKTIINIFYCLYLLMRLIHVARKTVFTCAPFWVPFGLGLHLHAHQMNLANCRRKTVMTLSNATVNSQIKGGVE